LELTLEDRFVTKLSSEGAIGFCHIFEIHCPHDTTWALHLDGTNRLLTLAQLSDLKGIGHVAFGLLLWARPDV
jgi:hypothetical protein